MNCLKLNKILLLFLLFFFCKDFRADAKQSEVFDEYSRTHFFPREENEAFFEKQYGKAKEFLENKITTDEQINVNRLACFRTFYKNILEESDFYKEYKCGDPLFNEVLIDKCLFSQDYKKDIYLNEILKDCNGSKAFELVTILSFFKKNDWKQKNKIIKTLFDFFKTEEGKVELEKINKDYQECDEDEDVFIKIFSDNPTSERFDFDDYTIKIDFTDETQVKKTFFLLTGQFFRKIPTLSFLSFFLEFFYIF